MGPEEFLFVPMDKRQVFLFPQVTPRVEVSSGVMTYFAEKKSAEVFLDLFEFLRSEDALVFHLVIMLQKRHNVVLFIGMHLTKIKYDTFISTDLLSRSQEYISRLIVGTRRRNIRKELCLSLASGTTRKYRFFC